MEEIWKDIANYNGRYQISNEGNVKSIYKNKKERILKKAIMKSGYYLVSFSKNCKLKSYTVHRLVAIAFIENTELKRCVNHIDGNKLNNSLDNLEWCTHSENNQHAYDIGSKNCLSISGSKNHNAKLSEKDVLAIRSCVKKRCYCKDLSSKYGVSRRTILQIKKRDTWKCLS